VESAHQVAQSLLQHLNEPLEIAGRMVHIGASIGVAVYPDDAVAMEPLCIAADMRMYGEKNVARRRQVNPGKIPPQAVLGEIIQPDLQLNA
jgi:GGDEF domain-containing protein